MYGKTLDLKEDPLCLERLYGMRKLRDHAGTSHKIYIPLKKEVMLSR